jgi:hypothetical protein
MMSCAAKWGLKTNTDNRRSNMLEGLNAPEDWGVADKDTWVAEQTLSGEALMPALEGRDIIGFSEITEFAVKLAPGKPPGAKQWRDVSNRPVELDPSSSTWKLSKAAQKPRESAAQRMAKAYDRESVAGKIPTSRPAQKPRESAPTEPIESESVKSQVKEIEKRKQEKLTPEQEQREFNKKEYLKAMVEAILADPTTGQGAGKYDLSRDDMETYLSYLDGNKPTIPSYEITEEDVDNVVSNIKNVIGKGQPYAKFIARIGKKGDPPKGMANVARARAVIQHYLTTGGISSITGERIPFTDSQLDHRVSLDNGGVDGPNNWEWVEARFNQFKQAFTDEVVKGKLQERLSKSPLEERKKALENEVKNTARNRYKEHFKSNGFGGVAVEDIVSAAGPTGEQFLKAMAEVAGVSRYEEAAQRASGRAGGGRFIGYPALKQRLIDSLQPPKKAQLTQIDKQLGEITQDLSSKTQEAKDLGAQIRKERAEARKAAKARPKSANLSEADYLEILRSKRQGGANYADSMVFYKGKALGRCPAGTTRSGKTCVPSAAPPSKGPGYKQTDLGGLSQAQVKALSKARSTKDIIEAHKKSNKK